MNRFVYIAENSFRVFKVLTKSKPVVRLLSAKIHYPATTNTLCRCSLTEKKETKDAGISLETLLMMYSRVSYREYVCYSM